MNVLIDTNLIVYMLDVTSPKEKRIKATELINRLWGKACIGAQSLAEAYWVLARKAKMDQKSAEEAMGELAAGFEIIPYDGNDTLEAMRISRQHHTYFWDALLGAAALRNEIVEVLTEDISDFRRIPGLKAENPFE